MLGPSRKPLRIGSTQPFADAASGLFQGAWPFEQGISPEERFTRALNAGMLILGSVHGLHGVVNGPVGDFLQAGGDLGNRMNGVRAASVIRDAMQNDPAMRKFAVQSIGMNPDALVHSLIPPPLPISPQEVGNQRADNAVTLGNTAAQPGATEPTPTPTPQGQTVTPPQGYRSYVFVSPNVEEGLQLPGAIDALSGDHHAQVAQGVQQIADRYGSGMQFASGVGDWADGAENTLVGGTTRLTGYGKLRSMAAEMGAQADQKAVIPFMEHPEGTDALYDFTLPGKTIEESRGILADAGIENRTLIPTDSGTRVMLFDPNGELHDAVADLAEKHDLNVDVVKGNGEFLGSGDTREEGLNEYQRAVADYIASGGREAGQIVGPEDRGQSTLSGQDGGPDVQLNGNADATVRGSERLGGSGTQSGQGEGEAGTSATATSTAETQGTQESAVAPQTSEARKGLLTGKTDAELATDWDAIQAELDRIKRQGGLGGNRERGGANFLPSPEEFKLYAKMAINLMDRMGIRALDAVGRVADHIKDRYGNDLAESTKQALVASTSRNRQHTVTPLWG